MIDATVGDHVAFLGADDPAHFLYRGHPGLVVDAGGVQNFRAVVVAFVAGGGGEVGLHDLEPLSPAEYLRRSDRLCAGRHPLDDRRVENLTAPGHEWPEGGRPS